MRLPEYPEVSCRQPVDGEGGVYPCEVVTGHPGPCASYSVASSVLRRDEWEKSHPGWEDQLGSPDIMVEVPNYPGPPVENKTPLSRREEHLVWVRGKERYEEILDCRLRDLLGFYQGEIERLQRVKDQRLEAEEQVGEVVEALVTHTTRLADLERVIVAARFGWKIILCP